MSYLTALPREAVGRICDFCYDSSDPWYPRKGIKQPSLAALARTCRYLSDPALDVLWDTIESLVPLLLYTLPADLCVVVPIETGINDDARAMSYHTHHARAVRYQVTFLREPVREDFVRLTTYASRLRTLSGHIGKRQVFANHNISFAVWTKLLHYGPQPLLPNVRTLRHAELGSKDLAVPPLGQLYRSEPLLGPRLKEVEIAYSVGPSDQHRPTEIVKSLSYRSSSIESLTMDGSHALSEPHGPSRPGLLSGPVIGSFLALVEFYACYTRIAPTALIALGALPKLRQVTLHVDPVDYNWEALPHGRDRGLFPALVDLSLCGVSLEWCAAFMHIVTSCLLWSVSFSDDGSTAVPSALFQTLCTTLADHPSARTISHVSIGTGPWYSDTVRPETQTYQSQHIRPLLSLSALECLYVRGCCQVILDDDLLNAITWVWPKLASLQLSHLSFSKRDLPKHSEDVPYPKATLAGVLLLARYCPCLRSLDLPVDLHVVPRFDEQYPPLALWPSHESPLAHLSFSGSAFPKDKSALAMFLSVAFPHLQSVENHDDQDASAEILRLHSRFVRIRRQERGWALHNGWRLREPESDDVREEDGVSDRADVSRCLDDDK